MKPYTDIEQRIEEIQTDLEFIIDVIKQEMYKITFMPRHMLQNINRH